MPEPWPRATITGGRETMEDDAHHAQQQFAIVVGTLMDGIAHVVGPFPDESTARQWVFGDAGEDRFENWFSIPIVTPTDIEVEVEDC
jgi:hypothetical protein